MSTNLLSRVAGRIYWAARYLERAEDTARIVRANGEMLADLPNHGAAMWRPLIAIVGSGTEYDARFDGGGQASQSQSESSGGSAQAQPQARSEAAIETTVVGFLLSDTEHGASIVNCVARARENLRTTRETMPRDGWQALNDLYLYVVGEADRGVDRRARERYLGRVIADSRRLDGILATTMNHDEAYAMWRLGRSLERADMTTRVLGVRAAAVLMGANQDEGEPRHDELQWMGVLKSLSGLQMYHRAVRGPIVGAEVVRFLLEHDRFPRAVRALLRELRRALAELPDPGSVIDEVDAVDAALRQSTADGVDGAELDDAMDAIQVALAQLDRRIHDRYLRLA